MVSDGDPVAPRPSIPKFKFPIEPSAQWVQEGPSGRSAYSLVGELMDFDGPSGRSSPRSDDDLLSDRAGNSSRLSNTRSWIPSRSTIGSRAESTLPPTPTPPPTRPSSRVGAAPSAAFGPCPPSPKRVNSARFPREVARDLPTEHTTVQTAREWKAADDERLVLNRIDLKIPASNPFSGLSGMTAQLNKEYAYVMDMIGHAENETRQSAKRDSVILGTKVSNQLSAIQRMIDEYRDMGEPPKEVGVGDLPDEPMLELPTSPRSTTTFTSFRTRESSGIGTGPLLTRKVYDPVQKRLVGLLDMYRSNPDERKKLQERVKATLRERDCGKVNVVARNCRSQSTLTREASIAHILGTAGMKRQRSVRAAEIRGAIHSAKIAKVAQREEQIHVKTQQSSFAKRMVDWSCLIVFFARAACLAVHAEQTIRKRLEDRLLKVPRRPRVVKWNTRGHVNYKSQNVKKAWKRWKLHYHLLQAWVQFKRRRQAADMLRRSLPGFVGTKIFMRKIRFYTAKVVECQQYIRRYLRNKAWKINLLLLQIQNYESEDWKKITAFEKELPEKVKREILDAYQGRPRSSVTQQLLAGCPRFRTPQMRGGRRITKVMALEVTNIVEDIPGTFLEDSGRLLRPFKRVPLSIKLRLIKENWVQRLREYMRKVDQYHRDVAAYEKFQPSTFLRQILSTAQPLLESTLFADSAPCPTRPTMRVLLTQEEVGALFNEMLLHHCRKEDELRLAAARAASSRREYDSKRDNLFKEFYAQCEQQAKEMRSAAAAADFFDMDESLTKPPSRVSSFL